MPELHKAPSGRELEARFEQLSGEEQDARSDSEVRNILLGGELFKRQVRSSLSGGKNLGLKVSDATSASSRKIEDVVVVASTTGTTGDIDAGSSEQAISCKLQSRDVPSGRLLGKGLSGVGYETTWKGKRYARKDFLGVPGNIFEKDAAVLVGLKDHKNIVKTFGWTVNKLCCSLVLEYMDDDLLSLLQKRNEGKSQLSEALDIMLQIARGMEYLHEQGVAHGDLKTKNILAANMKEGDQYLKIVKVTDFGLDRTKRKSIGSVSRQVRKLNIVKWKAPEYLKTLFSQLDVSIDEDGTSSESDSNSEPEKTSTFPVVRIDSFAADVYSFAVTCSQVLTGKDPYPSLDWKDLGDKILSGLRPDLPDACCPPLLRAAFVSWWGDAARRPTFSKIRMCLEQFCDALLTTEQKPKSFVPLSNKATGGEVPASKSDHLHVDLREWCLRDRQKQILLERETKAELKPSPVKLWNNPSDKAGASTVPLEGESLRQAVVAVTESVGVTNPCVEEGTVRYRECQRNHAASIGGHAVDGCKEFQPGKGEEGSVEALKCTACDCHRNFHRREVEGEVLCECEQKSTLPGVSLHVPQQAQQQVAGDTGVMTVGKPRLRYKFTTHQKDQMSAFAENLGWRIQKRDEAAVQQFCKTVGVTGHVLKVWMHNNKHKWASIPEKRNCGPS